MTSTKQIEKHRPEDNRTRVLVTVRGGVAEAFYDESTVMVEIFDYDEYAAKGKEPEPYLDDLVQDWGFPDPREASPGPKMSDTPVESRCKVQRVHPNYELYRLMTEDAQAVAEKELGRKLTEEEIGVVGSELPDYNDWGQAMTLCIRQRIAGEL